MLPIVKYWPGAIVTSSMMCDFCLEPSGLPWTTVSPRSSSGRAEAL